MTRRPGSAHRGVGEYASDPATRRGGEPAPAPRAVKLPVPPGGRLQAQAPEDVTSTRWIATFTSTKSATIEAKPQSTQDQR